MKRLGLVILSIATLGLMVTGCSGTNPDDSLVAIDGEDIYQEESVDNEEENLNLGGDAIIDTGTGRTDIEVMIENLVENEYPQLEITAAVLERMAILPGSTVRLNIVLENKGDSTISFVKGSGSYRIPQALYVLSDEIQTILPIDRLGIATMDFVTETLAPGESLSFDYYLRMTEPNKEFDTLTRTVFMEDEVYVGDLSWEELQGKLSDLIPLESGSYEVSIFFLYSIVDDSIETSEEILFDFSDATGYNMTTIQIAVN